MKATVVGTRTDPTTFRQALAAGTDMRVLGHRAWAALALDVPSSVVEELAARVGEIVVIEVEMPRGGRGRELYASRYDIPRETAEADLTEEAREILHDWRSDSEGGFDEEVAARELAWKFAAEFAEDSSPARSQPRAEPPPEVPFELAWARALIADLVASKSIELEDDDNALDSDVAMALTGGSKDVVARTSALLERSAWVVDLFIDDDELASAIARTRPASPNADQLGLTP